MEEPLYTFLCGRERGGWKGDQLELRIGRYSCPPETGLEKGFAQSRRSSLRRRFPGERWLEECECAACQVGGWPQGVCGIVRRRRRTESMSKRVGPDRRPNVRKKLATLFVIITILVGLAASLAAQNQDPPPPQGRGN